MQTHARGNAKPKRGRRAAKNVRASPRTGRDRVTSTPPRVLLLHRRGPITRAAGHVDRECCSTLLGVCKSVCVNVRSVCESASVLRSMLRNALPCLCRPCPWGEDGMRVSWWKCRDVHAHMGCSVTLLLITETGGICKEREPCLARGRRPSLRNKPRALRMPTYIVCTEKRWLSFVVCKLHDVVRLA